MRLRPGPLAAGVLSAGLIAAGIAALPGAWREAVHERILDALLTLAAPLHANPGPATRVVVVDIDARSLAAMGPWPWARSRMAELVAAAGRAGAGAVAIDILFEGADAKSPATLARRLAAELDRPDLRDWAETLADGDRKLADALDAVPVALGFALDPDGTAAVPAVPFLARGEPALPQLWRVPGGVAPFAGLLDHVAGLGALALPGDDDGLVRRVPLLVGIAGQVHPGLAAEAVRLAEGASAYQLDGATLGIGGVVVRLPPDGLLRLVPGQAAAATIPAADFLGHPDAVDRRLHGAIVLIGGSAPELGGLRATPGDPLTPSVLLHAAAIAQLLRGVVPLPVPHAAALTAALGFLSAIAGFLSAAVLRPVRGAVAIAGLVAALVAGALVAAAGDRLFDPAVPIVLAVATFATAALVTGAETQLREARIRQRFAQHLAPAVVELIAARPSVLKLRGERREITALFTDVEGFTAMTHRAEPEALVAVLDDYFEGVAGIVIAHGGMIDKLVGDAVHAFFNTPLDLADHPIKAVRCAIAIRAWTETYRRAELPQQLGFGRTRIGVETGDAIVGDIGIRAKLDYTAHGDAVNAAARFEAANKQIGSAICVGPQAASRCPPDLLRPTGTLRLRGFSEAVRTFEPWPEDADAAWRARYLAALAGAEADPAAAAAELVGLAAERPGDAVPGTLAESLRQRVVS